MRIAVISDTHDAIPRGLLDRLAKADEIWHLGDVSSASTLSEIESLGVPTLVVSGNCDYTYGWPGSLTLEREGRRCHLVHIPPPSAPAGVHMLLHGHTHVPRDETDPLGVRWLNPGSVSLPRGGFPPSFAWLEFRPRRAETWSLETLPRPTS